MPLCLIISIVACKSHDQASESKVVFAEDRYRDSMQRAGAGPAHRSFTVSIEQMKFQPDLVTVGQGDTVIFVNNDIVTHDITEEANKEWSSQPLAANASWRFVPAKSASYYCSIHPVMKGRIEVQ